MLQGTKRVLATAAAALAVAATPAGAASLYDGPGPRPGPDILYADPPRAPQLENTGDWKRRADPRLRRDRLPRRRVPLPGLPLRRPRRAASAARPGRPAHRRRHVLGSRTAPTRTRPNAGVRAERGRPRRAAGQAARRRHRVPADAQHDARPRAGRRDDRDRRLARAAAVAARRQRDRAGAALPDLARRHAPTCSTRPPARRSARRRTVDRRQRAPPDRAARPARGVEPGHGDGQARRRRRPLGPGERPLPDARRRRDRDAPRRRRRAPRAAPRSSTSPSAPTEPLPDVSNPAELARRPGLVARPRSRAPRCAPATSAPFRADVDFGKLAAGHDDDSGVPHDRPDQPHPRLPLRDQAGRRLRRRVRQRRPSARASCAAGCSPTRSTCPRRRAPNGYGLTLLLHSLGANYNQFRRAQPVAVRRARHAGRIVAHARRAAAPTAGTTTTPAPTRSRCGPTSRARYPLDPALTVDRRLLDGRLRHLQVRDAVPRPVRQGPADGRPARPRHRGRRPSQPQPAARRRARYADARRRCATSRS